MTPRERLEAAGWKKIGECTELEDKWKSPVSGLWYLETFGLAQLARDEAKETSDGRVLSDSGVIAGVDDIRDSRIGETMKIAPVATSVSAPDEAELEKQWIADGSTNSFKTWLIRKVAELQGWKESQMACTPDYQEIGKLLDVRWGESVHDKIVPGICALRDSRDRLQEALRELQAIVGRCPNVSSGILGGQCTRPKGHNGSHSTRDGMTTWIGPDDEPARAALGDPPERGWRND